LFGLILTLLFRAVRSREVLIYALAGAVAGLLPLAQLGAMLTLAIATPLVFLWHRQRGWIAFFLVWVVLAVPQLLFQLGGGPGALAALRWAPGWVASPDSWLWFWTKNLGLFAPLLIFAMADRRVLGRAERRLLGSFAVVFVAANLIIFQPWDQDNSKILVYWYLTACVFVATLLTRTWRQQHGVLVRAGLIVVVVSMLLSGLLINLQQLLRLDRHLFLTQDELRLAERVRATTEARAVFAAGLQHNHPVSVLAGRRVMVGFPGWLWSGGYDYEQRERDVRTIFSDPAGARRLLDAYRIDYIVVGPYERDQLHADPEAFRELYPTVTRTDTYEIFAARPP
jgi:hypothetical protein